MTPRWATAARPVECRCGFVTWGVPWASAIIQLLIDYARLRHRAARKQVGAVVALAMGDAQLHLWH